MRGIRSDAAAPENPEGIRGAKERLTKNMSGGRRYLEVDDQPALVERMDLAVAVAIAQNRRHPMPRAPASAQNTPQPA